MTKTLCLVLVAASSLFVAAGCKPSTNATSDAGSASNEKKVAVQLNWYAEAEHGGVYQAKADGTYDAAGLNVEIRPGGRATPVAAEVVMGRADFAITNADDVVLFRAAGSDIVALTAAMQDNPRCIMVNKNSDVTTWEGLKGMTLQRQEGQGFVEFLRARGMLNGIQEVPYHGSVSNLVSDPKIAVQAYSFAEPYLAKEAGADVNTLMVSDLGWNPYSSVLVTRGELVRKNPELVRAFVEATNAGWQHYLTDPEKGNAAILAANQHGMTADALTFGSAALVSLARPDDMDIDQVGKMTDERWTQLVDTMVQLKMIEAGKVKPEDCFTNQFLRP